MSSPLVNIAARPIGALLLILFALSLFWCPDAACRGGEEDEGCMALLCALVSTNVPSGPIHGASSTGACVCPCHLQTIPVDAPVYNAYQTALRVDLEYTLFLPVSPSKTIKLPPRA
jgi:hypothetical protein